MKSLCGNVHIAKACAALPLSLERSLARSTVGSLQRNRSQIDADGKRCTRSREQKCTPLAASVRADGLY
jgi:hypothetical protein